MARSPRFSFPMPTDETLRLIPRKLAERFRLLPIRRTASTLTVVTSNPKNVKMLRDLERQFGLKIDARRVSEDEMSEALAFAFGGGNAAPSSTSTRTPPTSANLATPTPSLGGRRSTSDSQSVPSPSDGLQSLESPAPVIERTSGDVEVPSLSGISAGASGPSARRFEETLGGLDDTGFEVIGELPRPSGVEPEEGLATLFIERARAQDEPAGTDEPGDLPQQATDALPAGEIREMLLGALRMGASELFLDSLSHRVLLRARIGFRTATLQEFDSGGGGKILSQLRVLAGLGAAEDAPEVSGRIQLQLDDSLTVDVFLRTVATGLGESAILDVVKYPGGRIQPLQPLGLGDGSPTKLRDLLASRLGDKRLASVVAKQLTRPPSMLAVVAPRHRNRESMLALLAGALAGPALGQRVVQVGEHPRYFLEDHGVVPMPCEREGRLDAYRKASGLGSDYLILEECADYEELAMATEASVGQHVIVGIPGADPIDILIFLTEAPEPRRLAQRLGSILFLDAQSMKIVEMNQPLREAVGSMEDAGTFVQMFEGQAETAGPRPTSTEVPAMDDPFQPR